ncbi:uncharacterized protein [Miscanthus floridulus]|uniref:uncharacterized protein n=1 Tax=Miscanthus floridulus TaxID=154761 RepID=UPI00345A5CCA
MAYYSESSYCAEEARRPYAEPGFCHGEGGERYAVIRKEYEEVDEVARAGRGHDGHGHGHGHLVHSGSNRHVHGGHEGSCHGGYLGEHREQHHVHGNGHGGRLYDACESKRYDSCTGQYYA